MKKLIAGIVTPESNYVLMPDGTFGPPGLYQKAQEFDDQAQAGAALDRHLPAFVRNEEQRTNEAFKVNSRFFAPGSEFELTVDEINAIQLGHRRSETVTVPV